MLEHGGRLLKAAEEYGIPLQNWLDLSTGINPHAWPIPEIPKQCWSRLPEDEDDLISSAITYYQCQYLLPVAGSQAAIQALPHLFKILAKYEHKTQYTVGVINPSYNEHAHAWQKHDFNVLEMSPDQVDQNILQLDILILVNPNNPSGHMFSQQQLLNWHQQLSKRQAWLIVDEAFIDSNEHNSLSRYSHLPNLIVLRSLGKFFGLAGARVGFLLAQKSLLNEAKRLLGPWTISGPARFISTRALRDYNWQITTRQQLKNSSLRLQQLLKDTGFLVSGSSDYFVWLKMADADLLHTNLAKQGVFTRLFNTPKSIRFGLPESENDWLRLQDALHTLNSVHKNSHKYTSVAI